MYKYRPKDIASHQDDEKRRTNPFSDEANSSVNFSYFEAARDETLQSDRLRASQLGLIEQSASLPQEGVRNAQADVEATTIAPLAVDVNERTEHVHDAGSRVETGTSSTTERRRYWQRRLKAKI